MLNYFAFFWKIFLGTENIRSFIDNVLKSMFIESFYRVDRSISSTSALSNGSTPPKHVQFNHQTSFRKIALNSSSISKKIIHVYNLNTLLEILIQNTAYYLEITLGLLHKRCRNIPSTFPTRRAENLEIRRRP